MGQVMEDIRNAWGNYRYFALFIVLLLLSVIFLKKERKHFVVPLVIISVIVINPLFYKIWNDYVGYAYFRALWMIPVILTCAAFPAFLIEKAKGVFIKIGIAVIAAVLFIFLGHHVYSLSNTGFIQAQNADKIPNDAAMVAEALLEIDDEPYVVTTGEISIYLRMYSGKIHEPYAREAVDWTPRGIAAELIEYLRVEDYSNVFRIMADKDYKYLVVKNNEESRDNIEDTGVSFIRQVGDYGIFMVSGTSPVTGGAWRTGTEKAISISGKINKVR